jgi:hypothetical protein
MLARSISRFDRARASLLLASVLTACSNPSEINGSAEKSPLEIMNYAIASTYENVTVQCMRREGFRYRPLTEFADPAPVPLIGEPMRQDDDSFGLSEVVRSINASGVAMRRQLKEMSTLGTENRAAFQAAQTRCQQVALARMNARLQPVKTDLNTLRQQFDALPEVVRYRDLWRACMRRSGFTDATRSDLVARLLGSFAAEFRSRPEVLASAERTAVRTDRKCISQKDEDRFQSLADSYVKRSSIQSLARTERRKSS